MSGGVFLDKQEQTAREQKREELPREHRRESAPRQHGRQLPVEARSAGLLLSGDAASELPTATLEVMASALGNSGMLDLMHGGDDKPETYAFTRFGSGEGEDEPNRIRTGTPELCATTGAGIRDGPLAKASDPRGIRDRLTPGNIELFGAL